jgi:hypothetical protein
MLGRSSFKLPAVPCSLDVTLAMERRLESYCMALHILVAQNTNPQVIPSIVKGPLLK